METRRNDAALDKNDLEVEPVSEENYAKNSESILLQPVYLHILINEIIQYLSIQDQGRLSLSCRLFHTHLKENLKQQQKEILWQATVDGKIKRIKSILDKNPQLLLEPGNLRITSQLTWQSFTIVEKPMEFALKRRQLKVASEMLAFFPQLENGREEALQQWKWQEVDDNIKNLAVKKIKELVEKFIARETFTCNPNKDRVIDTVSEETKQALIEFREYVLPNHAIRIDEHIEMETLLSLSMRFCLENLDKFNSRDLVLQVKLYCLGILRFIQSTQIPEDAQVICNELIDDVNFNKPLTDKAKNYLLEKEDNKYFYRKTNSLLFDDEDLDAFVHVNGKETSLPGLRPAVDTINRVWNQYINKKEKEFNELRNTIELWPMTKRVNLKK